MKVNEFSLVIEETVTILMNNHISQMALHDEGFAFDPQTGTSFQVSETGIVVLRALKEGDSAEQAAARLSERYDVSLDDARRDCADFSARLKHFELL